MCIAQPAFFPRRLVDLHRASACMLETEKYSPKLCNVQFARSILYSKNFASEEIEHGIHPSTAEDMTIAWTRCSSSQRWQHRCFGLELTRLDTRPTDEYVIASAKPWTWSLAAAEHRETSRLRVQSNHASMKIFHGPGQGSRSMDRPSRR